MSDRYLEILDFTYFYKHMVFVANEKNILEKRLENKIHVSVGIELVTVDMSADYTSKE